MAKRTRSFLWLPVAWILGGTGCDSEDDDGADDLTEEGDLGDDHTHTDDGDTHTDDGGTGTDDGTGEDGGDSGLPDLNEDAILQWLEEGGYTGWTSESAAHPSAGPHNEVRVFINPALETSLMEDAEAHPQWAAAVKELFDQGQSLGWVVAIKAEADSAEGANWYWLEYRDGQTIVAGLDEALCTGCHGYGVDYIRSTYPLN